MSNTIGTLLSPTQSVGPDYRPETQKPTATISTKIRYENVHILPQTPQLIALLTYVPPRSSVRRKLRPEAVIVA